ncbi:MAG: hypothetical protein AB1782_20380 [Cyanobacteriota bacterium]
MPLTMKKVSMNSQQFTMNKTKSGENNTKMSITKKSTLEYQSDKSSKNKSENDSKLSFKNKITFTFQTDQKLSKDDTKNIQGLFEKLSKAADGGLDINGDNKPKQLGSTPDAGNCPDGKCPNFSYPANNVFNNNCPDGNCNGMSSSSPGSAQSGNNAQAQDGGMGGPLQGFLQGLMQKLMELIQGLFN